MPWLVSILVILSAALLSCEGSDSGTRQVKNGDIIQVNYTGKLADGTMFDTNVGRGAFEFAVGKHQVIEGFETAVIGMKVGEKKIVNIPADKAYGQYNNNLVFTVSRSAARAGANPSVGSIIEGRDKDGNTFQATVVKIEGDTITVDANHRLAGKDLIFEIELLKIL